MSWFKANIAWGHLSIQDPYSWVPTYDGNYSPLGPYYNSGWEKTGSVPEGDYPYGFQWYNSSPIPLAPSNLTATIISDNTVKLSWIDNSMNETGFQIFRVTHFGGNAENIGTVGINQTYYYDYYYNQRTTWKYYVKAFNSSGSSDRSNEAIPSSTYN